MTKPSSFKCLVITKNTFPKQELFQKILDSGTYLLFRVIDKVGNLKCFYDFIYLIIDFWMSCMNMIPLSFCKSYFSLQNRFDLKSMQLNCHTKYKTFFFVTTQLNIREVKTYKQAINEEKCLKRLNV